MLATTATATTATTAATATGTFFFDRNAHTDTLECFFLLISFHPLPPPSQECVSMSGACVNGHCVCATEYYGCTNCAAKSTLVPTKTGFEYTTKHPMYDGECTSVCVRLHRSTNLDFALERTLIAVGNRVGSDLTKCLRSPLLLLARNSSLPALCICADVLDILMTSSGTGREIDECSVERGDKKCAADRECGGAGGLCIGGRCICPDSWLCDDCSITLTDLLYGLKCG